MSTKNIFDFESRVEFLLESYNQDITEEIAKQGEYLDSDIANHSFNLIEEYLTKLYENIRVLEEVIDYSKIYIDNEINSTITECRELLNEIENMNDTLFEESKSYTSINVPLVASDSYSFLDRDGSSLKPCEIYNGNISLSGTIKNSIDIENVSVKRKEQVYESNYKDLINNESYRAHYLLDDIVKDGVTEEVRLDFKTPQDINSIKIKLSNCKMLYIVYLYEDNTESFDDDISKGIIPARTIKGIKIILNSTNYTPRTINILTNESNKFEDLDKAWKEVHEEIKDKDLLYTSNEYKSGVCDYLENIYLKEVSKSE